MNSVANIEIKNPRKSNSPLEELLIQGAQKMLQIAIENEVNEYCNQFQYLKDEKGFRTIVRNGYLPERKIQSGIGPVTVRQPRVRDRKNQIKFSSAILPKYMRRSPSIENLIPALYLKGIATGDMQEALISILGENAKGLSPANIVRLKQIWETEFHQWQFRDFSSKEYVYIWADGIYFNVRLDEDRPCILVIIGVTQEGNKEILAIHDGHRESTLSWREVLQDLKRRGLNKFPSLAIGDGALGFWAALREEFGSTKEQKCWVHKTANVLDKMAKGAQGHAKNLIHEIVYGSN